MDRRRFALLEALKTAAVERGEIRLYRRGKLPGLFAQRTRANADLANEAIQDGLLEVSRVEPVGKTPVEWIRVTQKGLDFLLNNESPTQALQELREVLAVNEQGMPAWIEKMNVRLDDLSRAFADEIGQMRRQLQQLAERTTQAIERIEAAQPKTPAPPTVPWAHETLEYLERRKQVGLGERCPLADLFTTLRAHHADLSIKDFHIGLKRLHERQMLALLPSTGNGDAPGPEYALLDGASLYYYVGRA